MSKIRTIRITYTGEDGRTFEETTNMAAHLTDEDMLSYFGEGKIFNIGNGAYDYMAVVRKAEIIN